MYIKVNHLEVSCKFCRALFKPTRKDKIYCSHKCKRNYGKTHLKYSNGKKSRNRIYLLYKNTICSFCGFIPEHPCQLDVDHIDGNRENNCVSNLQTLCANCHRLKTAKQLGWYK